MGSRAPPHLYAYGGGASYVGSQGGACFYFFKWGSKEFFVTAIPKAGAPFPLNPQRLTWDREECVLCVCCVCVVCVILASLLELRF